MGMESYTASQWLVYSATAFLIAFMVVVAVVMMMRNRDGGGDAF